ncbi:MAG: DUF4080 domain-containing protein [Planctomycetaceae bacterium]|nr:DUF4080 domain-containing protein [Planctomycetaceae bacterium]
MVLATLNARYSHSSFGLRCLLANMGELQSTTRLLEFTINDSIVEILATVLAEQPQILGLGVYIWNVRQMTELVADLRRVRPDVTIVLGGPELSDPTDLPHIASLADFVICGEADLAFPQLCRRILASDPPNERVITPAAPTFDQLQLPYDLYSKDDIRNRVIYVEASRGCPFTCEFCLSAREIPVRAADIDRFLAAMQSLLDRGVRQFKFVDRTFNLNIRISQNILQFFLDRYVPGLFLHFEMIPDRLPDSLRTLITRFPPGALQFEIGVQTFNEVAGNLISRRQDVAALERNFQFLREETGVHIHADLIIGLPGESEQSFAAGFDRLYRLQPQEIQVGILKRLRGTPITRHDNEWQMVYSDHPPYEILCNRLLTFDQLNRLRRFSRYWDLIGNSGNFNKTRKLWLGDAESPFAEFLRLAEWLYQREGRLAGISLIRLMELVFNFLTQHRGFDPQPVAEAMWRDYRLTGRRDRPTFLRSFELPHIEPNVPDGIPVRQKRHLITPPIDHNTE